MLEFKVILHRGEIDARMRMKVHVEMTQGFCFERPELIQKQKEIVQRVLRLAAHVEGDAPLHERAYSILILCRRDHELDRALALELPHRLGAFRLRSIQEGVEAADHVVRYAGPSLVSYLHLVQSGFFPFLEMTPEVARTIRDFVQTHDTWGFLWQSLSLGGRRSRFDFDLARVGDARCVLFRNTRHA